MLYCAAHRYEIRFTTTAAARSGARCPVIIAYKAHPAQFVVPQGNNPSSAAPRVEDVFTMDVDVDKFIFEIEQRPAIWNLKCHEYSDRVQKLKKWEEIINMFTDDGTSDEEKRIQGQLLQKRWKTLRDAFAKERRQLATTQSGSATTNRKQYKYYKQLLFLAPVISTNTPHNCIESEEEKDPVDNFVKPHDDNVNSEPKKPKKGDPTENIGNELLNVLKSTMQQKNHKEDTDRQFLLSLMDDFKRVPARLKTSVKINILKCIIEAQDEMSDYNQAQELKHDK